MSVALGRRCVLLETSSWLQPCTAAQDAAVRSCAGARTSARAAATAGREPLQAPSTAGMLVTVQSRAWAKPLLAQL